MSDLAEIFASDGALASGIERFSYRPQQEEMAEAVDRTINAGGILVCEAGTGTGKTFAYLVPALLSGLKIIISTGTKNLQDQLFHRDLPLIRDCLALPVTVALLKGRGNYLCRYRLNNARADGVRLTKEQLGQFHQVLDWSLSTRSGDIAEIQGLSEDAPIWPLVTSTGDNCLGQECPELRQCHLLEARKKAQEADLLVINHHLLCADMALKEDGFGEVLPGADAFIIDEAHQLPEVASQFFGQTLSGRQLLDLARDLETEYQKEAGDVPDLVERIERLKQDTRELRLAFGLDVRRGSWDEIRHHDGVQAALARLGTSLQELAARLESISGRAKGLDNGLERCQRLLASLQGLVTSEEDQDIRWFETQRQSFRLNRTPLDIAEPFSAHMQLQKAAWVFTSATLAVGGRFDHFTQSLGLEEAETNCWDSPFDYPRQAVWYLPKGLPDPGDHDFNRSVSELTLPILQASQGRAFLLYTSHKALQEAAEYFQDKLDYPMLVQGTAPRNELIERFRSYGNAVLLGTASFWEGVDVRGDALSCVIIDKLPFASPGDPVLQARIDAMRKRGGNPFFEYQVPQAAINLKQGAGRLIRDVHDRGVLVICDPRLMTKSYGKLFVRSLPPMTKTQDIEVVRRFFSLEVAE